MLTQWSRLSLYLAIGLTVNAIVFPPFIINNGPVEYGFLLSGPPSVSQAMGQASFLGGAEGARMARGMIHYGIEFVRLILELGAIWGIYFALSRKVLKPAVA